MTYHFPRQTDVPPPRDGSTGKAWWVAVLVVWTVNPMLFLATADMNGWLRDCSSSGTHPDDVPSGCPREGLGALASLMVLGMWILATILVALVIGVVQGRNRRFANGRAAAAVLVGIGAPWAMLAYAVGNGLGRLLPAPAR